MVSGDKDRALDAALTQLVPRGLAERAGIDAMLPPVNEAVAPDVHVTAVRRLPAAAAEYADWPEGIHPEVVGALRRRGIEQVYSHQAEAMRHALDGQHVVVVTPTASGKTLCYNGPVLSAILSDPAARALYLFPTKALAQDQLAELHALSESIADQAGTKIGVFTYDGDTPQDARRAIRQQAHVVLSNPDMLHAGVLPHHPKWAKLFENLRYIVIDELHAYRGVFGSHLANILRRLQRICRHYGSTPTFICCSATIANPRGLAEHLTERPFALVDRNGAPRGEKFFLFVNPPVVNEALGIRRSYLAETRRVALEFLKRSLQIIVFAQSRLATEILTTYLKDACEGPPGTEEVIRGYRGGYLPLRRREIERGLRQGSVRAVVSTSALELGIDIGALDVSVMAGYPGTVAGTWQRAGRAGRRSTRSAAVLVASSAPLDQFIVRHPSYFFDASPEHALINPDNLHILLDHIKCAAFELPFTHDEQYGAQNVQEILQVLADERFVHFSDREWHWMHESYPADAISLRSISSDNFVIVDNTRAPRVVAETDYNSAFTMLHEKAIYILEGQLYQVERLDVDNRKAYVREVECDYYTDAITYTRVSILDEFARGAGFDASRPPDAIEGLPEDGALPRHANAALDVVEVLDAGEAALAPPGGDDLTASRSHGEVHVVSRVIGFKKIKFYTNENVGAGDLDLPEHQMHTTSYWLTLPQALLQQLPFSNDDRRDGVSGLAHAMHSIAQLLLMCDRSDLGVSVETGLLEPGGDAAPAGREQEPRIFIYDNYPGGIGFSAPLYDMHHDLVRGTRQLIGSCACDHGCPSCVGPQGDVGPQAKIVALALLDHLLGVPGPTAAADDVPF